MFPKYDPVILLSTNNARALEFFKKTLDEDNYVSVPLRNGRITLEYLQQTVPDIAILDTELTDISGLDIANRMRCVNRLKDTPIIMFSPKMTPLIKSQGALLKIDGYLNSYLSKEIVLKTLDLLLRKKAKEINTHIFEEAIVSDPSLFEVLGKKTKKSILFVDSSLSMRTLLSNFLRHEGYGFRALSDLVEAQELIKTSLALFDTIILDLKLPNGSGFTLLKEIRSLSSSVPIIILSAFSDEATKQQALQLGASCYVRKPFSTHELLTVIRNEFYKAGQSNVVDKISQSTPEFLGDKTYAYIN